MSKLPKFPVRGSSLNGKIKSPGEFSPSVSDRRAATGVAAGYNYGTGFKQPVGRMRSDSVGYRPASKKKLGTPPKQVV